MLGSSREGKNAWWVRQRRPRRASSRVVRLLRSVERTYRRVEWCHPSFQESWGLRRNKRVWPSVVEGGDSAGKLGRSRIPDAWTEGRDQIGQAGAELSSFVVLWTRLQNHRIAGNCFRNVSNSQEPLQFQEVEGPSQGDSKAGEVLHEGRPWRPLAICGFWRWKGWTES